MPAARRTRMLEWGWRLHRWLYRQSGGRLGGRLFGIPALKLTTVGRRSGLPREVMLHYLQDGQSYVVIASHAGEPTHPAWYLNLRENPEALAQIGGRTLPVRARVARAQERERLWRNTVELDPSYAVYQRRTDRQIPVVVLDPWEAA